MYDPQYRLVDRRGFIKRRKIDGSVQEFINPLPEAQLPAGVPLAVGENHLLNPDASAALPVALGFVSPELPVVSATMSSLEILWNQTWEHGGYGRYHVSSEPDSPGPWSFPSLFIARACVETENLSNVWRILRWLNSVPGARAGSWFEFYGHRVSPPFPQVCIVPWTWAEMLILLIQHVVGIQPQEKYLRIRPRLLPGTKKIQASFPFKESRVNLEIKKGSREKSYGVRSSGRIIHSSEKEAHISYSKKELWIEVSQP